MAAKKNSKKPVAKKSTKPAGKKAGKKPAAKGKKTGRPATYSYFTAKVTIRVPVGAYKAKQLRDLLAKNLEPHGDMVTKFTVVAEK